MLDLLPLVTHICHIIRSKATKLGVNFSSKSNRKMLFSITNLTLKMSPPRNFHGNFSTIKQQTGERKKHQRTNKRDTQFPRLATRKEKGFGNFPPPPQPEETE